MTDISSKNLLLEEYKSAFEHLRYMETKRDRYVPGVITASGAVFALATNIFSKDNFVFREASSALIVVIFLLCSSLGFLSFVLCKAYETFSPVMKHYENAITVARSIIYGDEEKKLVKINCEEKALITWLDTRKNESIANRDTKISNLSVNILRWSSIFWFVAAVSSLFFMLCRCYFIVS
ncbi:MAG: hypothetical protein ABSF79_03000 [Smithellaceae bacterium]|jgi:hypothetical protein